MIDGFKVPRTMKKKTSNSTFYGRNLGETRSSSEANLSRLSYMPENLCYFISIQNNASPLINSKFLSENDIQDALSRKEIEIRRWKDCSKNYVRLKSSSLDNKAHCKTEEPDYVNDIQQCVMSTGKQNVNKFSVQQPTSGSTGKNDQLSSGGKQTLVSRLEQRSRSHDLTKKHSLSSGTVDDYRSKSQEIPKIENDVYHVQFDFIEDKIFEIINVSYGSTLREAISCHLEKYGGPSISQVNFYLDNSTKPLPQDYDFFKLKGHHITVKAKDDWNPQTKHTQENNRRKPGKQGFVKEDRKESFKKHNQGQKLKKGLMINSDDGSVVQDNNQTQIETGTWKSNKHKTSGKLTSFFTNPFKNDKDKLEALIEQLRQYDQTGIPANKIALRKSNSFQDATNEVGFSSSHNNSKSNSSSLVQSTDAGFSNIYYLEKHWAEIVDNVSDLPENIKKQQDVIWELVQTEVDYINLIKVITDLFIACLVSLQQAFVLNEIEVDKLFNNIAEVNNANEEFWKCHILPMLSDARERRNIMNPEILGSGFLQFDTLFEPYTQYCVKQPSCLQYLKSKNNENELFKAYLAWCESQKECSRLRLIDMMVMPMQRLTKYSLLLERICEKTTNESMKTALQIMNQSVQNFVLSVNSAIRQQHEQARLASIINRIESYDVLESSNDEFDRKIKEFCQLDLTKPMPACNHKSRRHLLLEGSNLKLRDASASSKIDVHCFLFTDMLLVCKSTSKTKRGERVKIIKQPFIIDRLVVSELKDGNGLLLIYLNEYEVVTSAFILQCNQDTKVWFDGIFKAQALYKEAKKAAEVNVNDQVRFEEVEGEEFCYDSNIYYLTANSRSPRDSSRPSLLHSNSGSTDISDSIPCPPNATPNTHARGISLEFGEPRMYSMSSDEGSPDQFLRNRSGARHQISPKLERRAFLMKSSSSTGPGSPVSSNMLTVAHPYHFSDTREVKSFDDSVPPPSLTVPSSNRSHLFPDMKVPTRHNLIRSMPVLSVGVNKPPLVKTKNISHANSTSALGDSYPGSSHQSMANEVVDSLVSDTRSHFEENCQRESISTAVSTPSSAKEMDGDSVRGIVISSKPRRNCRQERRYYTADTLETIKRDINNDSRNSIQKRFSWNYGGQHLNQNSFQVYKLLRPWTNQKCHSSDSIHSSSGVSSSCSAKGSTGSDSDLNASYFSCQQLVKPMERANSADNESIHVRSQPGDLDDNDRIRIDVGEIEDGISSVKIKMSRPDKATKADLIRMKHLLLTDTTADATEV